MSHSTQFEIVQRLVDGELDDAQMDDFFDSLDDNSAAWRDISLAFVEQQIIDKTLKPNRSVSPTSQAQMRTTEQRQATSVGLKKDQGQREPRGLRIAPAMGLALAFAIGIGVGIYNRADTNGARNADVGHQPDLIEIQNEANRHPPRLVGSDLIPIDDEQTPDQPSNIRSDNMDVEQMMERFVANATGDPNWDRSEYGLFDPESVPQNVVSSDFWLYLLQSGYLIEETPEVVPVAVSDQKSISLPIRRVNIRYLGHQLFQ